jgi:hypothetical protein
MACSLLGEALQAYAFKGEQGAVAGGEWYDNAAYVVTTQ